jgi:hypothetical protein
MPAGHERHEDLVYDVILPHHALADFGAQTAHRGYERLDRPLRSHTRRSADHC